MTNAFCANPPFILQRCTALTITLVALLVGPGCIPPPAKTSIDTVTLTPTTNPTGRPAVYISKVTDLRQFTADLSDPSVPCLITAADVSDPAIKSQTIGIYHKTNVMLQPGQTPETLVTEAIANGLKAKGYTVVPAGSGGIPVEAEITKCWMWAGRGDMGLKMETDIEINLKSSIVIEGSSQTVQAEYDINTPFTTVSVGLATVDDALDALSKNIQPAVKAP